MTQEDDGTAAAVMVEAALVGEKFGELMGRIGGYFARWEPRSRAAKYVSALMGDPRWKNGWTIAADAGDATPDRIQRLLNRAVWDTFAVMAEVCGFAVAHLDVAAGPGTRYGELKEAVADAVVTTLTLVRERYLELADDLQYVRTVLRAGADHAHELAARKVRQARAAIGLLPG